MCAALSADRMQRETEMVAASALIEREKERAIKTKVYDVTDECSCWHCGGYQKLTLHEDYVEYEHRSIWFWPAGLFSAPCCCETTRTAVPYSNISSIYHDTSSCCATGDLIISRCENCVLEM